jgi:hypothetical protein
MQAARTVGCISKRGPTPVAKLTDTNIVDAGRNKARSQATRDRLMAAITPIAAPNKLSTRLRTAAALRTTHLAHMVFALPRAWLGTLPQSDGGIGKARLCSWIVAIIGRSSAARLVERRSAPDDRLGIGSRSGPPSRHYTRKRALVSNRCSQAWGCLSQALRSYLRESVSRSGQIRLRHPAAGRNSESPQQRDNATALRRLGKPLDISGQMG